MSDAYIELRHVTFGYERDSPVLRDVSARMDAGVTLLLGPNGSGKSTLLKLAAGVEKPDAGEVLLNGHDAWRDEAEARRDLAYVPEEPDVTPYASVREVLRLVCRLRDEPLARADDAAAAAGLSDLGGRSVRQLSKGQRRRALLAAAWIGTPATLVLDEPLEGLDLRIRGRLTDWLKDVRGRGGLAAVASHEIEPLAALADRAIAVDRGRVERFDDLPARMEQRLELLQRLARGGDASP